MTSRNIVKALPEPLLPSGSDSRDPHRTIDRPAGNATQPFRKARVRRKARADQAILLEKGANALPVSDYPLKEGPVAANTLDLDEQSRSNN